MDKYLLTDINGKDTDKAIADLEKAKLSSLFSYRQAYFVGAKAQLSEVLSLLEPVELEALGVKEIKEILRDWSHLKPSERLIQISQATIQYNQSKGQLFRLKEVE